MISLEELIDYLYDCLDNGKNIGLPQLYQWFDVVCMLINDEIPVYDCLLDFMDYIWECYEYAEDNDFQLGIIWGTLGLLDEYVFNESVTDGYSLN